MLYKSTRRCALLMLVSAIVGCNSLTNVDAPGLLQSGDLDNPAGAETRRVGAIAAFANAFAFQAQESGLLVDEFNWNGSLTDRRSVPATESFLTAVDHYPYDLLSQTRIDALRAIHGMEAYNPDSTAAIAELYGYVGLIDVMFAEDLCSGVPLGVVNGETPGYGPTATRSGLLQDALAQFDSGARYAHGDSIQYLLDVGRARALVDSGNLTAAATAAGPVPVGYVYQLPYDGVNQVNQIYASSVSALILSVSDREGENGLNFISAQDPRVPVDSAGLNGAGNPIYALATFTSLASPIALASGIEAQLIGAEALLTGGNADGWASSLNTLRAQATPAIPPLTSDSTSSASPSMRIDVTFRERAFWLFATGHRQGDLRRLVRYYGRTVDTVFPTGVYVFGGQYADDVTFVPFNEQADPNFHGCVDRNP